ncbi:MAG TPA: ankyrin repeat domain-containing protein [Spirochaetia bacterium]|nr:ankyrin repeat domain-containing protein [Spirochaetia bacterium]
MKRPLAPFAVFVLSAPLLLAQGGPTASEKLIEAIRDGDTGRVQRMLESGADPNTPYGNTYPFIGLATARGIELGEKRALLASMRQHGADPNIVDHYGRTALMYAFFSHEREDDVLDLMDAILSAGADINAAGTGGRTLLSFAASYRNLRAINWMLDRGASTTTHDGRGMTVLHSAFQADGLIRDANRTPQVLLEVVRTLVVRGVDINWRDQTGATPLALADADGVAPLGVALNTGSRLVAAYLKAAGARMYVGGFPAGNTEESCRAVLAGDLAAVRSIPLPRFSEMVARTSSGVPATALHLAAEQGTAEVVAALVARKANWNIGDRYGRSPLQLAAESRRWDIAAMLVKAGADANFADTHGNTPLERILFLNPRLFQAMLADGIVPKDDAPAGQAIRQGSLDLLKACMPAVASVPEALKYAAALGQLDIVRYLAAQLPSGGADPAQDLQSAEDHRRQFDAADAEASVPQVVPRTTEGISRRRGAFPYTLESWSPWLPMKADKKLKDFPVGVFVPDSYDGSQPFGLLVSMIYAQSSNQFPRPDVVKVLTAHHLLWVGFDPYNGIYVPFQDTHESLALAAVYQMMRHFLIDPSRVYLAGFSWGGRQTGEIVPREPRFFKGGIAIGGFFTTGDRLVPALSYGRRSVSMVAVTGDYNFNRQETFDGYDTLVGLGYRASFIQQPMSGHSVPPAAVLEAAIRFLDAPRGAETGQ